MYQKLSPYILALSLMILGLAVGFFFGKRSQPHIEQKIVPTNTIVNRLYSTQTATIRGEITKVSGDILSVKNLNTQAFGDLKASARILIYRAGPKSNNSTPSANLSSVELNKEALIQLEMANGQYEVTNVQYLAPSPSLPPLAKP